MQRACHLVGQMVLQDLPFPCGPQPGPLLRLLAPYAAFPGSCAVTCNFMRLLVGGRGVFVAWQDGQEICRSVVTQVRCQMAPGKWAACKTVGLA
jgi:hypothetical protein